MITDVLGKNIKQERKNRAISLKVLAYQVQVSPSFLSQIENGKNDPSLATLKKIATCLGVTVSKLLGEEESTNQMLIKRDSYHKLSNLGDSLEIEFLSSFDPNNIMETCIHCLAPSGKSGAVPYSHIGQEIFFVLEGTFSLMVDDQTYYMEEGDCFYLNDCMKAHQFSSLSKDKTARMLCISSPPFFYSSAENQKKINNREEEE